MSDTRIRPCGVGWEYCDGICKECTRLNMSFSLSTTYPCFPSDYPYEEVYGKQTTTDGKTQWFGTYTGVHKE